jgi:hypothetical protein
MSRSVCLVVIALLLAFGTVSCTGGHNKNAPLVAATNAPIADVPVPAGFTMTPDSTSKVVPGNNLRFVDHRYKGSDDAMPVAKFYRDQLPQQGWTWVDQNQARGGEISLHFTKKNEDCFITVTPGTWDTYVRIRIDPVGRNAPQS